MTYRTTTIEERERMVDLVDAIPEASASRGDRILMKAVLANAPSDAHNDVGTGALDFTSKALRMKRTVEHLFKENASAGQAPAIECQILLEGGYQAMGALSITDFGTLRFMAIGQGKGGGQVIMAEHFFDWEDLRLVVVPRAMAEQPGSRIITG